jgi:hypothetical protein
MSALVLTKFSRAPANTIMSWLLAVVCLFSCSSCCNNHVASKNANRQPSDYPESVLSALPQETLAEVMAFANSVSLPVSTPFGTNEHLRQVYLEWYQTGYAFAFITANQHVRDWGYHDDQLEKAKFLGWFDGNSAGGLAKRLKDIDSAARQIGSNHSSDP